jgi:multiple sugar transport system substrate-binding protein
LWLFTVVLAAGMTILPCLGWGAVTLRFQQTEPSAETIAALQKAIAGFEAKNPGIKVEMETVSWAAQMPKLIAALASGQPPDVAMLELQSSTSLGYFGNLLPLDDVVSSVGRDDFAGNTLQLTTSKGQVFAVPYLVGVPVLYYRKDLFKQANIAGPPKTWDEWLQDVKTLGKAGAGNGIYGVAIPFGRNTMTSRFFYYLAGSNNAYIFDESGKPTFNSPAMVEALEFMRELAKYSPPGSSEFSYAELRNSFSLGKAATTYYWGRLSSEVFKQNPEVAQTMGLAIMPAKKTSRSSIALTALGVFKGSQHPNEAKQFIRFLLEEPNYVSVVNAVPTAYVPARKSVATSPAYLSDPFIRDHPDLTKVLPEALNYGGHFAAEHPGGALNPYFGRIDAANVIPDMVQKCLLQGVSAEEAVSWAGARIAEIVDQAKKEETRK